MPSDTPHKELLQKLSDITTALQKALDENDSKCLASLSEAHKLVFEKLTHAGMIQDHGLAHLLKETIHQIVSVSIDLKKRQEDIRQQLTVLGNRKKILGAYHAENRD